MPPKRRTRPAAARAAPVMREDPGPPPAGTPGGGDAGLSPLPDTFPEAVQRLVELVHCVVDNSVTMFKLEMANVSADECAADVVDELSAKAQQDICVVAPLCEVRPSDLPANGCSALFDQRQYAEALLHAARAHFAFVEFDRRLIFMSTAGVRDPKATSHLLYAFSYLRTATGRAESTALRTTAKPPADTREVTSRRRTVAVLPRRDDDDDIGDSSIGNELERFRNKLDRVERGLLEASQSMAEEDMRLPDTTLDSSLDGVPVPLLGAALHAVLPRVQAAAAVADRRAASQRKPLLGAALHAVSPRTQAAAVADRRAASQRGAVSRPATTGAVARTAPAAGRRGKRRHSLSPEPAAPDTSDSDPAPSKPAASPPTPSRKSSANLPTAEADQLVAFFQRLNVAQSEQSRVSLTCRYAKMRYSHDVPSGVVYRLVETARRQGAGPAAAAAGPEPLSKEGRQQAALAVYAELDPGHSEQSRVAYTLQYLRVQHALRLDANTLFGWLGQGAKKPSAKKAKTR